MIDLEVSGLNEISPLRPVIDSKRRQFDNKNSKDKLSSQQLILAMQKMRAMPTVMDLRVQSAVFVLFEDGVRMIELDGKSYIFFSF